ncbi:MAG: phage tail tube protein [Lachnospiraceae bacterium]
MEENRRHISLRQGKVARDGEVMLDTCKIDITYKVEVSETKSLGEMGTNRKWIGRDVEVVVEEYRANDNAKKMIEDFESTGKTPEYTIQGIRDDHDSDYYDKYQKDEVVTVTGCVPKGDISALNLDMDGDVVKDTITYGGKKIKFN